MGWLLVSVLACGFAAAEEPGGGSSEPFETIVIQLKWQHQFQFAGYYLAHEKGYFAEEGLRVELREDADPARQPVVPQADYFVDDTQKLLMHLNGEPVALVAQIFQVSPVAVFAQRGQGILTAKDLAGKTLMGSDDPTEVPSVIAMLHRSLGSIDQVKMMPHDYDRSAFIAGEIDAVVGYVTDLPFHLRAQQHPYTIIDPGAYGIDFYGDGLYTSMSELRSHPGRAQRVRRAVLRGWRDALEDPEAAVDLIQRRYDRGFSREALLFEATMTRRVIMPDLIPLGDHNRERLDRIAAVYHELGLAESAELRPGFLAALPQDEALPLDLSLTAEDRAWLANHPVVRVAITPNWAPIEFVSDGEVQGLSPALLDHLQRRLPIRFEYQIAETWSQALQLLRQGEVDLLPAMATSGERHEIAAFTDVHTSVPIVLYGREESPYVESLHRLADATLGVMQDSVTDEFLQRDHADFDCQAYATIAEGLDALQAGEISYFIGTMPAVSVALSQRRDRRIRVRGTTPYAMDLAIGIRRELAPLRGILDRALAALPSKDQSVLRGHWMSYVPPRGLDLRFLWWLTVPVAAVLVIMLIRNRRLAGRLARQAQALQQGNNELQQEVRSRERIQEDLDRSNELLGRVLEALPAALIAVDARAEVRYANAAAIRRLVDQDPLRIGGEMVTAIDGHPDFSQALQEALEGRRSWQGERRMVGDRYERLQVHPLHSSGALIQIEDLTEQATIEAELVQARKMEGVGQLAGGIAHDFNNVLQVIDGSASLAMNQTQEPGVRRLIDRILGACRRAADLTRGLLSISRPKPTGRVPVSVAKQLAEIVELCRHTFPKNIAIHHRCDRSSVRVLADPGELHGALLNIALNARDAMPDGGTLTFACQESSDQAGEEALRLVVSDTGVGMDEAVIQRIFEPFFTTKPVGRGTGLGLPGAQRAIHNCGGTLAVDSTPGAGTDLLISLPIHDRGDASGFRPALGEDGSVLAGAHILVVDDEPVIRESIDMMLQAQGASCTVCAGGEEAIAAFRVAQPAVDVVLIDMVMPGMHGAACLDHLAQIDPGLRAIIMSGHIPEHVERALPAGIVQERLTKPFSAKVLVEALARVLHQSSE